MCPSRPSTTLVLTFLVLCASVPEAIAQFPVHWRQFQYNVGPAVSIHALADLGDQDPSPTASRRIIAVGDAGTGYVHFLDADSLGSVAQPVLVGGSGAGFGAALSPVPDLNGDGLFELAVGEPGYSASRGRVRIFSVALGSAATLLASVVGDHANDRLGQSVVGLWSPNADLAVGVSAVDVGGITDAGQVRVYRHVPGGAPLLVHSASGTTANEQLGWSVTGGEDLDGDGIRDYAAGGPGFRNSGLTVGVARIYSGATHALIAAPIGQSANARFGASLTMFGDSDCDGRGEFAVGAPGHFVSGSSTGLGQVVVFSGGTLAQPNPTVLFQHSGTSMSKSLGTGVQRSVDLTGDNITDLIIAEGEYSGGSGGLPRARVVGLQGSVLTLNPTTIGPGSFYNIVLTIVPPTGTESPVGAGQPQVIAGGIDTTPGQFPLGQTTNPYALYSHTGTQGVRITAHPQNMELCPGGTLNLSGAATWTGPIQFQWFFGPDEFSLAPLPMQTSSQLTIPSIGAQHAGRYRLRAIGVAGSGTSSCQYIADSSLATVTLASASAGPRLVLDQSAGPGSLVITVECAPAASSYFTALTFDPNNQTLPNQGWWFNLHIPMADLLQEWSWNQGGIWNYPAGAPFRGTVDANGRAEFVLGPGTIGASAAGLRLWGVTCVFDAGGSSSLRTSPVASLAFPVSQP